MPGSSTSASRFISAWKLPIVHLPTGLAKGDVLQMPIGHMEGNYFCTPEELHQLEAEDRIAFRYATPGGEITRKRIPTAR
jgi:phosphoribosylformylglycinamidine (FGAM) synthase-like amidotransferase family enzyme